MNHGRSSLSRERLRMAEDNKIQSRGRARRPHKAESERLLLPLFLGGGGKGEKKQDLIRECELPSDRRPTEHYSSSSHRLTTAKSARPRTIKRMPPPPSALLWGIGAISFWKEEKEKAKKQAEEKICRNEKGNQIRNRIERAFPSVVKPVPSSPLQKRTHPFAMKMPKKGAAKSRQGRGPFCFISMKFRARRCIL